MPLTPRTRHMVSRSPTPRSAYNTPWGGSKLRYVDDARPFWRHIVSLSVGSNNEALFEEVYTYYAEAHAWKLAPGAVAALAKLKGAGVKLAVCSNFDTRLRPVLRALGVDHLFDAIVVSAGEDMGADYVDRAMEWMRDVRRGVPSVAKHTMGMGFISCNPPKGH